MLWEAWWWWWWWFRIHCGNKFCVQVVVVVGYRAPRGGHTG